MNILINHYKNTSASDRKKNRKYLWQSYVALTILFLGQMINSAKADNALVQNITTYERLRLQLFTNYDKTSQPMYYNNKPTNLSLSMVVKYADIDELNARMTVHAFLKILWTDAQRQWHPDEYDGIMNIDLSPSEVWRPDIELFNGAGKDSLYVSDKRVGFGFVGNISWTPEAVLTIYCKLNLRHWPYDTQLCKVQIGSWNLRYDHAPKPDVKIIDYSDFESPEWRIIDADSEYIEKDYNYLEITIKLGRRSSMYTAVIYTPASCVILLALSVFWLPPQMGEKILLNGIVIVVIAAFLMYFAQLLPILADNTPLVVLFYSTSLMLVSISTIVAVGVLYFSTAKHKRRVPDGLKKLLNGCLGQLLCLSQFTLEADQEAILKNESKELSENVYDMPNTDLTDPLSINPIPEPTTRSIQFDWILLATAIDRIFFLCYCCIFIVLAVMYSV